MKSEFLDPTTETDLRNYRVVLWSFSSSSTVTLVKVKLQCDLVSPSRFISSSVLCQVSTRPLSCLVGPEPEEERGPPARKGSGSGRRPCCRGRCRVLVSCDFCFTGVPNGGVRE